MEINSAITADDDNVKLWKLIKAQEMVKFGFMLIYHIADWICMVLYDVSDVHFMPWCCPFVYAITKRTREGDLFEQNQDSVTRQCHQEMRYRLFKKKKKKKTERKKENLLTLFGQLIITTLQNRSSWYFNECLK